MEEQFDLEVARRTTARILPWMRRYFRSRVEGLENLPDGPFIGVGNHSGGILLPDAALWLFEAHQLERTAPLRVMAHDQLLRVAPAPIKRFFRRIGLTSASIRNAEALLRDGFAVQIYPGGDQDLFRSFGKRNTLQFAGRKGYVRLALQTRHPLVPVVSCGAHETIVVLSEGRRLAQLFGLAKQRVHVWPLIFGPPFGLWMGYFPGYLPLPAQITLKVLEPMRLDAYPPEAAQDAAIVDAIDREVRARMQAALDALAANRLPFLG